jgi:hypothetical protein
MVVELNNSVTWKASSSSGQAVRIDFQLYTANSFMLMDPAVSEEDNNVAVLGY